jgi:beta-ribofuranosylaminobenzene 5'-phosphate synthase
MLHKSKVKIKAFPRIHITLIGMNETGYRINGGLGFSIDKPSIEGEIVPAKSFSFTDKRNKKLDSSEIERIGNIINEIFLSGKLSTNIHVTIKGDLPTHSGFGSGTIIRLLCIESLFIINNIPYTKSKLIKLSRRGGTSGVGIRTYFDGGFVFDIGHKAEEIIPSSLAEDKIRKSIILKRLKMPEWEIGLCLPHYIISLTPAQEKVFFANTIPLKQTDVNDTLYHSIYGVLAAVKESDKSCFESAVNNIQNCKWKLAERTTYGKKIFDLEKILLKAGAETVGMSSLGPTIFFTAKDIKSVIQIATSKMKGKDCSFIRTKPNNTGRVIEIC